MMTSAIRNPQSAIPVRRMPAVKVGDFIQYRYQYRGLGGMSDHGLDTREVIEVVNGGAVFVVAGFYNVNACQIVDHIPLLPSVDETLDNDSYWFCEEED